MGYSETPNKEVTLRILTLTDEAPFGQYSRIYYNSLSEAYSITWLFFPSDELEFIGGD